jgi:hypothetical protein
LARQASDQKEWLLAALLLEVLAVADEFDRCDLGWDLGSSSRCYKAWLRYHLGWEIRPRDAYRMTVEAAEGLWGAVDPSHSDVTRPWLLVDGDSLIRFLTFAMEEAVDEVRTTTEPWIPFRPAHECVSVDAGVGPPVAQYRGVDLAGCPVIRLDTAAARSWGRAEVRRIAAHEVWPGHHLLAEQKGEPLHPILTGVDWLGFTEGWATYAEALASSAGPNERLPPAMALHLFRLALLARVDIGLHALGWSHGNAADTLDYWGGYTVREAESAVARILMTPGNQASYFLGYLTFRLLRESVDQGSLGSIKARRFHYLVLRHGPLPLGAARELVGGAKDVHHRGSAEEARDFLGSDPQPES